MPIGLQADHTIRTATALMDGQVAENVEIGRFVLILVDAKQRRLPESSYRFCQSNWIERLMMPKTNDRRMITIGRVGVIFTYLQSPPSSAPTSRFKLSTSLLSRESPSSLFLPSNPLFPTTTVDGRRCARRDFCGRWSHAARRTPLRAVQFKFRDVPTTGRDGSDLLYHLSQSGRVPGRSVDSHDKI